MGLFATYALVSMALRMTVELTVAADGTVMVTMDAMTGGKFPVSRPVAVRVEGITAATPSESVTVIVESAGIAPTADTLAMSTGNLKV